MRNVFNIKLVTLHKEDFPYKLVDEFLLFNRSVKVPSLLELEKDPNHFEYVKARKISRSDANQRLDVSHDDIPLSFLVKKLVNEGTRERPSYFAYFQIKKDERWKRYCPMMTYYTKKAFLKLPVVPITKLSLGDRGYSCMRVVNLLDCDKRLAMYLNPFTRLFEDEFYWWQCYEIFRRLVQTSFVVVVKIVDERYSLFYAAVVSFISVVLQCYFHPYKADSDDRLAMVLMINEYTLIFSMLCGTLFDETDWDADLVGLILLTIQCAIGVYVFYLIYIIYYEPARKLLREFQKYAETIIENKAGEAQAHTVDHFNEFAGEIRERVRLMSLGFQSVKHIFDVSVETGEGIVAVAKESTCEIQKVPVVGVFGSIKKKSGRVLDFLSDGSRAFSLLGLFGKITSEPAQENNQEGCESHFEDRKRVLSLLKSFKYRGKMEEEDPEQHNFTESSNAENIFVDMRSLCATANLSFEEFRDSSGQSSASDHSGIRTSSIVLGNMIETKSPTTGQKESRTGQSGRPESIEAKIEIYQESARKLLDDAGETSTYSLHSAHKYQEKCCPTVDSACSSFHDMSFLREFSCSNLSCEKSNSESNCILRSSSSTSSKAD
eukprot:CAMPEP_0196586530 /NCGR_PEP_ID=MMETSP1081-20130531/54637_1 /TAXON_ID=36882 /ORGANISM="Pyramimonas amylifera, Strain CCMP720" /LENGTH=604 /DNA_ID=CAMNT_0041908443 /DNA_START=132 /DNA_END=1949 /DNA_ORIENTATION=-